MTPHETNTFYPGVINNTNISFSNSETALLQKGLKHNLHSKRKNWIQNLALEAKTAITQLLTNEQEMYRKLVADRVETKLIKSMQTKLQANNALITNQN
jgi:ribosomal protein L16/L10AE